MVVAGRGVAGVADVADHFAAAHLFIFRQAVGVTVEVRVVVDGLAVSAAQVDGRAAIVAPEEFDDAAVGRREDGRGCARRLPPFSACAVRPRPVRCELASPRR